MLWIASVKQLWCVACLNTMPRGASVSLECYVTLLCFSINSRSFVGNLTLMSSLYSLEFRSGEFILVKSHVDILHNLQMTQSLQCCVMGSSPNMGWGLRGSRSDRSEPQHAWDSFWSASHVLESPIGGAGFGSEMVSASLAEIEAKKGASEKGMLVNAPSHEKKLQRRGRPRKKLSKGEENCLSVRLSVCPPPEGSTIPTNGWDY
jgi:hypothetical protein